MQEAESENQMTQQPDWKAQREAIRARVEAIKGELWERETDEQYIPSEQKHYLKQWVMNSGGKRIFDADSSEDVVLDRDDEGAEYDLNAHNRLTLAAHAPEDLRRLLAKSEEDERDRELFDQLFAAWQDRLWAASGKIKGSPDLGMETIVQIVEKRLADAALTSEFATHLSKRHSEVCAESALREQRISELEVSSLQIRKALGVAFHENPLGAIAALRKANEEVWEQAAKIADLYATVNQAHAIIPTEIAARLREAARQSREDEG